MVESENKLKFKEETAAAALAVRDETEVFKTGGLEVHEAEGEAGGTDPST